MTIDLKYLAHSIGPSEEIQMKLDELKEAEYASLLMT
jgi:hypothetical protein